MAGVDPVSAGLGLATAVGGYFSGKSAQKSQKELMRAQRRIADAQNQQYQATLPYYNAMLARYAQQIGLQMPGQAAPGLAAPAAAPAQGAPMGMVNGRMVPLFGSRATIPGAMPAQQAPGMGSAYGTPEDQLRLAQAEEDINRNTGTAMNRLRFQYGRMGLADASQAGALANVARQGAQDYANYRRQLAIQAPQEQERRFAMLTNLLNPGMGQGAAAAGIYGQQGGIYGQQAAQGFGAIGQAAQNFGQQYALQRYLRRYGGGGGGGGEPWWTEMAAGEPNTYP